MKSRLRRCFFFIVAGLLVSIYVFGADGPCIVPGRGHFQIRVGTARGTLTIRGKSQPATIPITLTRVADGNYRAVGEYKFKQTSFGIKPIQLAGGTVKVKDELQVEFELFLQ